MNTVNEHTQQDHTLTAEDYTKAMNFIGQNLLSSLIQSVNNIPAPLRKSKVVTQALSAFLANVIYKQFPEDHNSRQQMLDDLNKLIQIQFDHIQQPSK